MPDQSRGDFSPAQDLKHEIDHFTRHLRAALRIDLETQTASAMTAIDLQGPHRQIVVASKL